MLAVLAATLAAAVPQPTIVSKPIPFGSARKRQIAAYSRRHYGIDSYRLRDPKVIVQHSRSPPPSSPSGARSRPTSGIPSSASCRERARTT